MPYTQNAPTQPSGCARQYISTKSFILMLLQYAGLAEDFQKKSIRI